MSLDTDAEVEPSGVYLKKDCEEVVDSSDSDRGQTVEASDSDRGVESGSSSLQEDVPEELIHVADTDPVVPDPAVPEEAEVQDPGPRMDEGTGRVYAPDGLYLGRISVLRPGQSSEALSVDCSAHGRVVCKAMRKKGFRARYLC